MRLRLDRVRRTILDAVHRTSDWVVVIDPVFTEDIPRLAAPDDDTARYLIDAEERESLQTSRNIVVSTRSRARTLRATAPRACDYGLEVADDRDRIAARCNARSQPRAGAAAC